MTQFINPKPVAAMANMGARPDPYTQGMGGVLSLAEGGLARKPYLFGGIKRRLKKLIPKEVAGIMQGAAPFMAPTIGPWGAAALSGLGQYKSKGKINPLQLLMSAAPGLEGRHLGRFMPEGMTKNENVMRNLMGRSKIGQGIEKTLFGTPGTEGMEEWTNPFTGYTHEAIEATAPTRGWLGKIGSPGDYSLGDTLKSVGEGIMFKGKGADRQLDKTMLVTLGITGLSYAEAKKQMKLAGQGDLENDYGITEEDWIATDWSQAFKDNQTLGGNAEGGLPRVRHAMGSAQFPPQKRTGLQWGSDKGEGLGGEEVEADMRYTGGFMPYGDKPKADDVPARLSKDEFVFTDEAVAGMGEGDVNLGAERLYNMMKNLEQQGAPGQMGIGAMV